MYILQNINKISHLDHSAPDQEWENINPLLIQTIVSVNKSSPECALSRLKHVLRIWPSTSMTVKKSSEVPLQTHISRSSPFQWGANVLSTEKSWGFRACWMWLNSTVYLHQTPHIPIRLKPSTYIKQRVEKGISTLLQLRCNGRVVDFYCVFCKLSWLNRDLIREFSLSF